MEISIEYNNDNNNDNISDLINYILEYDFDNPYIIFENISHLLNENVLENILNTSFEEDQNIELTQDKNIEIDCELIQNTKCDNQCEICLENIAQENIYVCKQCKGEYHYDCINKWVQRNATCPKCRVSIKTKQMEDDGFEEWVNQNLKL